MQNQLIKLAVIGLLCVSCNSSSNAEPNDAGPRLGICSKLDFSGIDWPEDVPESEYDAFALALNISGSFEGDTGWVNLTNNFDGQGLSMGLLNQCLGQGSLQPMLVKMRNSYLLEMSDVFSADHMLGITSMLNEWLGAGEGDMTWKPNGYSQLDDETLARQAGDEMIPEMTKQNKMSVGWAKKTLYDSADVFKSDWQEELSKLSTTHGYRSIQIGIAVVLHREAKELFHTFQLTQLRSYLFLFDIMVQNGGISPAIQKKILGDFAANPKWDETQRLNHILEVRLKTVCHKYVADVRTRKQSIINGAGSVHGLPRDFNKEYCADLQQPMP